ncbi:MAG: tetratricopeptide repeat protein [candidate division WOR-3 bacterium]
MKFANKLFLFFCITFSIGVKSKETPYFSPKNIRAFGEYLYKEKEYTRAIIEFQRFLFALDSLPQNADSIFFKIAICYRLNEDYKNSIKYLKKIPSEYPKSGLLEEVYLELSLCYSLMDSVNKSEEILRSFLERSDTSNKALQLTAINYILSKKWEEAKKCLKASSLDRNPLLRLVEVGENLPKKNRALSGFLSTVIPGSGKYYCNRPMEGFHSFVTIGFSAWQAYEGFKEDGIHSVKGWIFGSLGVFLYFGNIYGSIVAADIYNEEQELMFKLSIKNFLNENF